MRPDATGVLLEALEPVVDVDHRGAGTDSQRLEQDALEAPPVDRELRDGQPRIESPGIAQDRLTVTVRHDQRAGADGDRVEGVEQPQAGELGDGRRENVDADAELADRVGLLEHVDADVPPVQGERGGETTDSPADHDRATALMLPTVLPTGLYGFARISAVQFKRAARWRPDDRPVQEERQGDRQCGSASSRCSSPTSRMLTTSTPARSAWRSRSMRRTSRPGDG